jgi:hypothetical protein
MSYIVKLSVNPADFIGKFVTLVPRPGGRGPGHLSAASVANSADLRFEMLHSRTLKTRQPRDRKIRLFLLSRLLLLANFSTQ